MVIRDFKKWQTLVYNNPNGLRTVFKVVNVVDDDYIEVKIDWKGDLLTIGQRYLDSNQQFLSYELPR